MNLFGITMMIKEKIIVPLEKHFKKVYMGRVNWQADSFHVYAKDMDRFKAWIKRMQETNFSDRVYNFYDDEIQEWYNESEQEVIDKIREFDNR
jgi:thymidylate synthase